MYGGVRGRRYSYLLLLDYLYRKNENRHTKIVSAFNLALRHDVCVV